MSAYDDVLALLEDLSWEEQLAVIGEISTRLRQSASEPEIDEEEEEVPEPDEETHGRRSYPRLKEMIEWQVLRPGEDTLYVEGHPDKAALLLDAYDVAYQGQRMPVNDWAKGIKGWQSISIYRHVILMGEGRRLKDIRRRYMDAHGMEPD